MKAKLNELTVSQHAEMVQLCHNMCEVLSVDRLYISDMHPLNQQFREINPKVSHYYERIPSDSGGS